MFFHELKNSNIDGHWGFLTAIWSIVLNIAIMTEKCNRFALCLWFIRVLFMECTLLVWKFSSQNDYLTYNYIYVPLRSERSKVPQRNLSQVTENWLEECFMCVHVCSTQTWLNLSCSNVQLSFNHDWWQSKSRLTIDSHLDLTVCLNNLENHDCKRELFRRLHILATSLLHNTDIYHPQAVAV